MKKKDLISEVAKVTDSKKQALMAVEIFINTIKRTLKKRDKIFISDFGTFSVVKRKARKGRNPRTGEAVKIAARFTPRFKAAKTFKETVK
ncbi:MAG TPA: HU family DNA-binding protein [Smithella sp.]|mgnify:FL=1|nr:HU family DNA-binding protein [Smithella sp.]HQH15549.1 HU family DNA-binding protein [Smithella sp.]